MQGLRELLNGRIATTRTALGNFGIEKTKQVFIPDDAECEIC